MATLDFMDDQFKYKRIYTAWDNIGDEKRYGNRKTSKVWNQTAM